MENFRPTRFPSHRDALPRAAVPESVVLAARACEEVKRQFEREVKRVEALRRTIDPEIRDWPGVPLIVEPRYDRVPRVIFARKVSHVMAHFEGPAGAPGKGVIATAATEDERQRLLAEYRAAIAEVRTMNERRRRAWHTAGIPFGPDPQDEQRYWRDWFDRARDSGRRTLAASPSTIAR